MKIELGAGTRPTPGYIPSDIYPQSPDVERIAAQDVTADADFVEEVLALGVIEHLSYEQARTTFGNVLKMLRPGGCFLFDVPNLPVWCGYLQRAVNGEATPFTLEHILSTLYGWQRWPGDEHRSGWTVDLLDRELREFDVIVIRQQASEFLRRGIDRRRFHRPEDAHLYVCAVK